MAASGYSAYFLLQLKRVDGASENEENEMLQKNIDDDNNSYNIVHNQEQIAVSSIASVVKAFTSLCSSGESWISNKNSNSGRRKWTQNETTDLIAICEEKEALYNIRHPDYSIMQDRNHDTKQYRFLSIDEIPLYY